MRLSSKPRWSVRIVPSQSGTTSYMKKTEQLPPRSLHYIEEYVNFNHYTNVDGGVSVQPFPLYEVGLEVSWRDQLVKGYI